MTPDEKDEKTLDSLFATARDTLPEIDDDFRRRLMPITEKPARQPVVAASRGFRLSDWVAALGGLGATAALGVWIGFVAPIGNLLEIEMLTSDQTFDISAFYAGADPGVYFSDDGEL